MDVVAVPAEHAHDAVCWLDGPGLNADVHQADGDNMLQETCLRSVMGFLGIDAARPVWVVEPSLEI